MAFNFGGNAAAQPAFGQAPAQAGAFQFNTAQQGQTTGMFGGQQAAGGFGTPGTTNLFGTPASQAGTSLFGTTQPAATATFGAPAATPAFGAPPQQTTGLFGQQAPTTSATGLTFGTAASTAATGGLTFGAPTSTAQATGLGFKPAVSTPLTGLSFGAPASSAPATGFSFGAPATSTPATGLSFGGAATSGGLTFGVSQASTAATPTTGFSLGTAPGAGLLGAAPGATPALGFTSSAATTTPTLGFGATTTTPTLGFGLGGTTTTATPLTSSCAPTIGLGGIASTTAKTTKVDTKKEIPPKEQPLPNEINQTVEQFKEFVKQQKIHSSEVARCSVREFRKVEQEIDQLNNLLSEVESQLQKNRSLTEKLKYDTAKGLQNIEMAQRTQDTPPGLQYDNVAPLKFFINLADTFEREMLNIKLQIENSDKYVKNHRNPGQITHQDLTLGMRRLHETFVALAGRLQSVHSQVESQKEAYLNLRKHLFNDTRNPFENLATAPLANRNVNRTMVYSPPKVLAGPTPFGNLTYGNGSILAQAMQQNQNQQPVGMQNNSASMGFNNPSFGTPIGTQPSNTALFGTTGGLNSFQLEKPPTGSKRGKM